MNQLVEIDKKHLRFLVQDQVRKNHSFTKAFDEISKTYKCSRSTVYDWYVRFKQNIDADLSDKKHTGRPALLNHEEIATTLIEQPKLTSRDLGSIFNVSHVTVLNNLHRMGYKSYKAVQIPFNLTAEHIEKRIDAARTLIGNAVFGGDEFFKKIVTSDEKWISLLNNDVHRRSWLFPGQEKPRVMRKNHHGEKVMLCAWFNWQGIVHYELLPEGNTVDAELYKEQNENVYYKVNFLSNLYLS